MENPVKPKEKTTVATANNGGLFFLLEVLIDKVSFVKSPCFSDKDFKTCVTIAAPAVEQLEICDDDPGACMVKSGGPFVKTFNSGKSCLFTLPVAEIIKAMSSFPIKVSVHKSLPCGCLPTKIIMGTATIDMTKEFVQSHSKYISDPTSVNCQVLNDSFQIVASEGGDHVGDIVMYLRISCFGNTITTGFQEAGQLNLGPTQETSIVDRSCNPRRDFQTSQDPCVCGAAKVAGAGRGKSSTSPPCQHGRGHSGGPYSLNQDLDNFTPYKDQDGICYCSGPKPPSKQLMVCRNMDQYCLHVPKGILPRLPIYQDLTKEKILEIKTNVELKLLHVDDHFISSSMELSIPCSEPATIEDEDLKPLTDTEISTEKQAKPTYALPAWTLSGSGLPASALPATKMLLSVLL
ncbi:hypothetical protein PYW07_001780 [Mythimna separata]|uniref:Uncharacterized protein n=1 Tax=Mythimna separata TaxID=271217 RepID=A0AAD7YT15_MYTSE|nr:hypothetical protein PYW07_001780 [Mythimna separata]